VPASAGGAKSCCYGWHGGQTVMREVCNLDGRQGGFTIGGGCELDSDDIRIYVRVRDGKPNRVRALNAECPVTTKSEVRDLGAVDPDASVRWLASRVGDDKGLDPELLSAIPMHAGEAAIATLTDLLEDQGRPMSLREQALFWLVQSESDEAFDYLDRLLTRR
jgi:hypothetical protein